MISVPQLINFIHFIALLSARKYYQDIHTIHIANIKLFYMIYQHNASTLLGSKRKAVYYPPDGSGRDSYIRTDNGGTNIVYKCQGVPQLGNHMKFGTINRSFKPASYTRFQKYASDGTGRDKYVVSHHGGQYNQQDENNSLLIKFRNTMRDGGWKKQRTSTVKDFVRPSQVRETKRMFKTQSVSTKKLSEPKKYNQNYLQKLETLRKDFRTHK